MTSEFNKAGLEAVRDALAGVVVVRDKASFAVARAALKGGSNG